MSEGVGGSPGQGRACQERLTEETVLVGLVWGCWRRLQGGRSMWPWEAGLAGAGSSDSSLIIKGRTESL